MRLVSVFLAFLVFCCFCSKAQIDSSKLDSLEKLINARVQKLRSEQEKSITLHKDSLPIGTITPIEEEPRRDKGIAIWIAGGVVVLAGVLLIRKKKGKIS